jgi:hypothetical protein
MREMLEAMGVEEIEYDEAERVVSYKTGIRCVKSSRIAFVKDRDGQYKLYFQEERNQGTNEIRALSIISPIGYPRIVASVNTEVCGVLKDKPAHATGIKKLPQTLRYEIRCAYSGDGLGLECIIEDLSPEDVKRHIGEEILLDTKGGIARLNIEDIPIIEDVLIN